MVVLGWAIFAISGENPWACRNRNAGWQLRRYLQRLELRDTHSLFLSTKKHTSRAIWTYVEQPYFARAVARLAICAFSEARSIFPNPRKRNNEVGSFSDCVAGWVILCSYFIRANN